MTIDKDQLDQITSAIRSVAGGGSYYEPSGLELLANQFKPQEHTSEENVYTALSEASGSIDSVAFHLDRIADVLERVFPNPAKKESDYIQMLTTLAQQMAEKIAHLQATNGTPEPKTN